MRKAWIVTVAKNDAAPEIFEYVSARKKIGQMEDYLCDVYEHLYETDHPDQEINEDELRLFLVRVSGIELSLAKAPYALHAKLEMTDAEF